MQIAASRPEARPWITASAIDAHLRIVSKSSSRHVNAPSESLYETKLFLELFKKILIFIDLLIEIGLKNLKIS